MIQLLGTSFIGSRRTDPSKGFTVKDRRTGDQLPTTFTPASRADVDEAAELAHKAFLAFRKIPNGARAEFLREIAANLEANSEQIIIRAMEETALTDARMRNELGRTCNQLRMFADLVQEGSWVDARIDHPDADRKPMPKPDMRSMLRPIGPVVVFGAANFPLAYSVAGGDTASALAAGNPVIVKAHPAHPGTSELVAFCVDLAARGTGMPNGTFSILFDDGLDIGQALVEHPRVQAVGFTGSRKGGLALLDLANKRPVPIPVFAEMSSVNPVFLLHDLLAKQPRELAEGVFASLTSGIGQFCTNPGIIVLTSKAGVDEFVNTLNGLIEEAHPDCMLTSEIEANYVKELKRLGKQLKVGSKAKPVGGQPAWFQTTASEFIKDPTLQQEVFGPCTLLVLCEELEEPAEVAKALEGNLTASFHGTPDDLVASKDLISLMELKVGRLIINQYPTGLEVCHSTVHGGPFPATSDGRSTSVGARAITRFARLVCYQNFLENLLPAELRDANPMGIARIVDGVLMH